MPPSSPPPRSRRSPLFCTLLVPLGLVLLLIWLGLTQPPPPSPAQPVTHSVVAEPPDTAATAPSANLRPALLTPLPAVDPVFATLAIPTPVRPYPRGVNAERRYHAPVITPVPASAQDAPPRSIALSPQDGRSHLLEDEVDLHTLTARRMVLDVAALESVVSGQTARLLAPQPDGSALPLVIHSVKSRAGMTHTLQGEVEGEPQSSVVQLVLHDGVVHGSVSRYSMDQHLEYRILASGYLMVRELDNASFTAQCGNPGEAGELPIDGQEEGEPTFDTPTAPAGETAGETAGYVTIDVVVGYDRGARVADGGHAQMEARIIASVDRMTSAFANSQVTATELMLLGTIEDPDYVFPGRISGNMGGSDELGDLNNTSAFNPQLNAVSNYATALGADLKAFVVKQADGSAGVAYLPGTSSITARDYMTSNRITFAHELGHNIGARHSWGDTSEFDSDVNLHAYGWRLAPAGQPRVRTIMAYDWNWGSGTRIPYFANPNVLYQGARTGQVNGYNATGDSLSDPRYVSGGLIGWLGTGFNGSRPNLGARNAHYLLAQAPGRANLQTRTAFQIVTPVTASTFQPSDTVEIHWTGGDHTQTVTAELFRGGVLQSQIATGLAAHQRRFTWSIPSGLATGNNYIVRLTLSNGLTADSGQFSVLGTDVFTITPLVGLTSAGDPGGPFAPEAMTYTLTSVSPEGLTWSAAVNVPWVDLNQTGGSLAHEAFTEVTVTLNSNAEALPDGVHHGTLNITDLNANLVYTRPITLQCTGRPQIEVEYPIGNPLTPGNAVIAFGEALPAAGVARRMTLHNIGSANLIINHLTVSGTHASAFTLSPLSDTVVQPGSSASALVTFRPNAGTLHQATLTITSNDSQAPQMTLQMTGTGIQLGGGMQLVSDINPFAPVINPTASLSMGSYVLFTAASPEHGSELWRTDGTDAGTFLLGDLNPGTTGSSINHLTRVGDVAYFAATNGVNGVELWTSDGTAAGTRMVRDISPGSSSSSPYQLTGLGETVYFAATNAETGRELWKSDGTSAGTVLVADLIPGVGGSNPSPLIPFKGELYFAAIGSGVGKELYKTNGTALGTVLVKDIQVGGGSSAPAHFCVVGETLYFSASDGITGIELWKTDGTAAGTTMVKDIAEGTLGSTPLSLLEMNGILYFRATTSASGNELWRSDGSAEGTNLVLDINPGAIGSTISHIVRVNDRLYFAASHSHHGNELWTSDGTTAGTVLVRDLIPGTLSSSPQNLTPSQGVLYFTANSSAGIELWRTDGSELGTWMLRDIHPGSASSSPANLALMNDLLIFGCDDGQAGRTLWRSDGTLGGTVPIADSQVGSSSSSPSHLANIHGTLFFSATTPAHGAELWKSTGTHSSTTLVRDIEPGNASSNPNQFTPLGESLVFSAFHSISGNELYWSNGTNNTYFLKDLIPGSTSSNPADFLRVGKQVFFTAEASNSGRELWRTNGTVEGTYLVRDIFSGSSSSAPSQFINYKNVLYFRAVDGGSDAELWRSDGTSIGTWRVKDINPGAAGSTPGSFAVMDGLLYFRATSSTHGSELWRTDGSANGTELVADIVPGTGSSSPDELTVIGSTLFFSAAGTEGRELWRSDGTAQGTYLVKDIRPGASTSNPIRLTASGDMLFFSAHDGISGQELWRSDGTPNGTVRVADIHPGSSGSNPSSLVNMAGTVYFIANDGVHGAELWQSDGSASNTQLVSDLVPGPSSSSPQSLTAVGPNLFFSAFHASVGNELFRLQKSVPQHLVVAQAGHQALTSAHSQVAFDKVPLLASDRRSFTLKNAGTQAITIASVEFSGPHASQFTLEALTLDQIFGNDTGTFEVVFTPLSFGPKQATLIVHSNDPTHPAFAIDLVGTGGIDPQIQWETPSTTPLPLPDASWDFGALTLGQTSPEQIVTVRNLIADSGLRIHSVTLTGPHAADFELDRSTLAKIIAAGEASPLRLRFHPLGSGLRQAQLTLVSNAVNASPLTLSLSGTGIVASGPDQLIYGPGELPPRIAGDGPFPLPFASTSGQPVTVEIVTGSGTLEGTTFTPSPTAGAVTFRLSQPGGGSYSAAPTIYRTQLIAVGRFVALGKGPAADHGAGIKDDGTLWTWGSNSSGQRGLGHPLPAHVSSQVGTETDWSQVALGRNFTLALKTDGSLWGWGHNAEGQLGIGSSANVLSPTPIAAGSSWKAIAAGDTHALAIRSDDTLWAWGGNLYRQCGIYTGASFHPFPTQVGTSKWMAISAGTLHSLGIRSDGTLWTWGSNQSGQIGHGTNPSNLPLTQIGTATDWSSIAAGGTHSLALRSVGTLWATGDNAHQQLGLGDSNSRTIFTRVGTGSEWSQIEAGNRHSVAQQSNGSLWSWGHNAEGELGQSNTVPVATPTRIGESLLWTSLACGAHHTIALQTDGTLWAAGRNTLGQTAVPLQHPTRIVRRSVQSASLGLTRSHFIRNDGSLWVVGNAPLDTVASPGGTHYQPTRVGTANDWTSITAGSRHTLALRSPGTLWAWGHNAHGALGTGTQTDQATPNQIDAENNWRQIATDDDHSAAIKADGSLWTWGLNTSGQLGHGDTTPSPLPTRVGPRTDWAFVTCAQAATYAIRTDGTLWAWGDNTHGRLGLNQPGNRLFPNKIGMSADWTTVTAGRHHALAIKKDGSLWAAGLNSSGQLGLGDTASRSVFTQVGTDTDWVQIVASEASTHAIKADGSLWTWGFNGNGQLGDAGRINYTTPTRLGNSNAWTTLATGTSLATSNLAITADGSLWGFGRNSNGQLTDAVPVHSRLTLIHPTSYAQTLSFETIHILAPGTPVAIPAAASSGLPLEYIVIGPASLNAEKTHLTVTGLGSVKLLAWQPGEIPAWRGTALTQIPVFQSPILLTQPHSQTVSHFDPVAFSIGVDSELEVTYQWRFKGQAIPEATEASYTIDSAQPADNGFYDVVVTNELGSTVSAPALLTVASSTPIIVNPPPSRIGLTGSSSQLTVSARGTPPLRYQWKKNGRAISGATSPTLNLSALELSDSASYSVAVSASKTVTSPSATVTVVSALGAAVHVEQGRNALLRVTDKGPTTNRIWTFNGTPLPATGRLIPSRDGKTLLIQNATPSDAGLYRCVVTHLDQSIISGATELSVFNAPPFIVIPQQLPDGIVSGLYTHQIATHAGATNRPTHYRATGLPPGVRCDTKTGLIQGYPTRSGSYTVTVTAANARGVRHATEMIAIAPLPTQLSGRYIGIIERDSQLNQTLGGKLEFTVTPKGSYSGKLSLGTENRRFKGQIQVDPLGLLQPQTEILIPRKTQPPLTLSFGVHLTSGQLIAGQIRDPDRTVAIQGWRNHWNRLQPATAYVGYYTYSHRYDSAHDDEVDRPFGHGFGTLSIKPNGTFRLSGKMADGTALSQSGFTGPQGQLGLFALLYNQRHRGSVAGHLTVAQNADSESAAGNTLSGQPTWFRPDQGASAGPLYPTGFGPLTLSIYGGHYQPSTPPFGATPGSFDATLSFAAGGLENSGINPDLRVGFDLKGRAVPHLANPGQTVLRYASRTGLWNGHFTLNDPHWEKPEPATWKRKVSFQGMITSQSPDGPAAIGSGYFLLPQLPVTHPKKTSPPILSGHVLLEPAQE